MTTGISSDLARRTNRRPDWTVSDDPSTSSACDESTRA
jgi:hypothetical protein